MKTGSVGVFRKWLGSELMRLRLTGEHWFLDDPYWPEGYCTDTCIVLAPLLRKEFEGSFILVNGRFGFRGREHPSTMGHTWIWDADTDIFLDPTLGQFTKSEDHDVIGLSDPLRTCYYQRIEAGAIRYA